MATPLMIAHRTPADRSSCESLASAGATVFEVDLMLAGDEIVLSHDLPLLGAVPWVRRDGLRFSVSRHPVGPTLQAVIDVLPDGSQLLLDLKCDRGTEAFRLVRRLLMLAPDPSRCHVSSKNWRSLEEMQREGFRTWRSVATERALRNVLEDESEPTHAVTVRHRLLTPTIIDQLHRTGRVMAWTVNDVARARELAEAGVDGITSDSPAVFSALAGDRKPG